MGKELDYVLRKRGDTYIRVDKQIERWRKKMKKKGLGVYAKDPLDAQECLQDAFAPEVGPDPRKNLFE